MNTGAVVGGAVGGGVIILVVITLLLILIVVVKVLFIRRGTLLRIGTQNSLRASSACYCKKLNSSENADLVS